MSKAQRLLGKQHTPDNRNSSVNINNLQPKLLSYDPNGKKKKARHSSMIEVNQTSPTSQDPLIADNYDKISDESPEFTAEEVKGKYVPHLVANVNDTILEDSRDESMNSSVVIRSSITRD